MSYIFSDRPHAAYYAFIVMTSFILNMAYVYEWRQYCSSSLLFPEHASQVGYNFYRHGSITRLYELATYQDHGVIGAGELMDKAPSIKDTVGYGFLLGLLWKVTGTTSFYGIIFLQIVLFALSICLIFQALCWFYKDQKKALYAVLGVLAFLPAAFLNVQPVKDMWSFYATAVVLWTLLGLIQNKLNNTLLLSAASFFAVCQWMRPTVFGVLMALFVVGAPVFYFYFRSHFRVLKKMMIYFFIINILVFWIPWISYNKTTYDRFFVGPTGLALLTSFGDLPNKWGIQMSEEWVGQHVKERYPDLVYQDGMQEYDDVIRSIFREYVREEPLLYFKNLAYRLKGMIFVNLPWTAQFSDFWTYNSCSSKWQALKQAIAVSPFEGMRFLFFFLYIRFFLLCAYLGIIFSLKKGDYILPCLIVLLIIGNCGEVISHIESKYLMQCYGFLGIFAGNLILFLQQKITLWWVKRKKMNRVFL